MPARLVPLLGSAVGLVLALLLVLGVAVDQPVLAAAAGGLLGVLVLAVQLDSWRRVRSLRNFVRDEIRRSSGSASAEPVPVAAAPTASSAGAAATRSRPPTSSATPTASVSIGAMI